MEAPQDMERSRDIRPVPDPTVLTTAALLREVGSLREILESMINGQREVIYARIEGMDKAIKLLQAINDRQPSDVDGKIANLEKLHLEKFDGINVRFLERDARVEQTAKDTKTAVDAAMAAQEKSAGKQADSFTKQIDALVGQMQQGTKATDDKFDDVKDRITRIEGTGKGHGDAWAYLVAGTGVLAALVGILVAVRAHV